MTCPTRRELEVIQLIADGKSAVGVAKALGLSFRTVQTHLANMREKLDAETTTHVVAMLFRKGLLS